MNVIWKIMLIFAVGYGKSVIDMVSEALCFFQTENFDNSQEKLEKTECSSFDVDSSGCYPLLSYKGVSCSSNLFSGSRRPIGGLADRLTLLYSRVSIDITTYKT